MKTFIFKTNINCGGCLAKVSPLLNAEKGIAAWDVDLNDPEKTLRVETGELSADEVVETVRKAGFRAETKETV